MPFSDPEVRCTEKLNGCRAKAQRANRALEDLFLSESTLDRLKEAIRRKRPGLLRRGVVLQFQCQLLL
ncbi:hypothetical protein PoB_001052700 [Plakobranchus ocellatus]|uniref:BHLH domain-containing protein n=1 Tax=Plakobranchus ocellatus TaxID=259542 RepID=A0AAV3YPG6_9GAST|nr:hypothetical protein PoB_001052700 [Plakobranchus ocellatus]